MRVRRRQSRRVRPGCRDATLAEQRARCNMSEPKVRHERRAVSIIDLIPIITPTVATAPAVSSCGARHSASCGGAGAQEGASMEEARLDQRYRIDGRWIQQRRQP